MFLKGLNISELDRFLTQDILRQESSKSNGKKISYRTKQILKWVYSKFQDDPNLFSDISKEIRKQIAQKINFRSLELLEYKISQVSDSIKFAFRTMDKEIVESVLMKHPGRYTVCVSTQVGCNVGCIFCASGMFGLKRNLGSHEIVEQLFLIQKFVFERENKRISNVVFMGMGEPLVNYNNVLKAIEIFTSDWGFNISKRNVTLSTSGILPRMYDLIKDNVRVKLALSLHSPFQKEREKLIPIAKRYHIDEVLKALENYYLNTKRRVTIEYILLRKINDSVSHAKELVRILKRYNMRVLINLIPYNNIGNVYFEGILLEEPEISRIREFYSILKEHFEVSIRWSLGRDIDGACGQLRRKIISN